MVKIDDKRFLIKDGQSKTYGPTLMASLGYFWNQLFAEKNTLIGYTRAASEGLIQRYYDLIDVVAGHSVHDCPVLSRERWSPLKIRRSELEYVPLSLIEQGLREHWTIGEQTAGDYAGITFTIGKYKSESAHFVIKMPEKLKKFAAVFNRILRPSLAFTLGDDISISDTHIYFAADPFSFSDVARYDVLADDGSQVMYTNRNGEQVPDQEAVLWVYHGQFDHGTLAENFGPLFNVRLPSSQEYKGILQALMSLTVSGPSVGSIKAVASAFAGIRLIQEATETVEQVYEDEHGINVVVTDRHVYQFHSLAHPLRPDVVPGNTFHAGDSLTDSVVYYDYMTSGAWWRHLYSKSDNVPEFPQITIPKQLFLGTYQYGVIFENNFRTVVYDSTADPQLQFPVLGNPQDVAEFQRIINLSQAEVMAALGLAYPVSPATETSIRVNPLDFIFSNFFKTSVAAVKLTFQNEEQSAVFFDNFEAIRKFLPVNTYLMFFVEVALPADTISGSQISDYNPDLATVNADGWITNAGSPTTPVARRFYTGQVIDLYSTGDNFSTLQYTAGYGTTPTVDYDLFYFIYSGAPNSDMSWSWVNSPTVTFQNHEKIDGVTYSKSATIQSGHSFHDYVKLGWFIIYHPDPNEPSVGERLRIQSISADGSTLTFEPAVKLEISESAETDTTEWSYEVATSMRETPVLFLN